MATMTVFITDARPWGPPYAAAEGDLRRQFPVIVVTYLRLRMPISCRDPADLTRWFVARQINGSSNIDFLIEERQHFPVSDELVFVVISTLLPRYTEENQGD